MLQRLFHKIKPAQKAQIQLIRSFGASKINSKTLNFSKIEQEQIQEKNSEPKWMRFFKDHQSIEYDIDRSLMAPNSNPQLIRRVIINSNSEFTDKQIVKSLFLLKVNDRKTLYNEIMDRIFDDNFTLDHEDFLTLFQNSRLVLESSKVLSSKVVKDLLLNYSDDKPFAKEQFRQLLEKYSDDLNADFMENEVSLLIKCMNYKDQLSILELFFNLNIISTEYVDYIMLQIKNFGFQDMTPEQKKAHFEGYSKLKMVQEQGHTVMFSEHFKYGWVLQTLANHIQGEESEFFHQYVHEYTDYVTSTRLNFSKF